MQRLSAADLRPEKALVRRSFGRAAPAYDGLAELQRTVAEALLADLPPAFTPHCILDVGAGTGYCTARLAELCPGAELIALDLAEAMLHRTRLRSALAGRCRLLCADAELLPLSDGSLDLLFSNLALQWCADLPAVFAEFKRVLRPGGVLLFSTFGADTLWELRESWSRVDGYSHVNAFAARESVAAALTAAGFADGRVGGEALALPYAGVDGLMRELKGLGAHNVTANRPRHLTGKGALRRMIEAYRELMVDGRIRASFEVLYGYARLDECSSRDSG